MVPPKPDCLQSARQELLFKKHTIHLEIEARSRCFWMEIPDLVWRHLPTLSVDFWELTAIYPKANSCSPFPEAASSSGEASQALADKQKSAPPTVAVAQQGLGHGIRIGTHFRLRRLVARLRSIVAIVLYSSGYL